ncbi:MAG: diguanylate cyclase [Actinomycetota bacterium]|nr:diguanylate cyclase [Actinomycetota bacterium]
MGYFQEKSEIITNINWLIRLRWIASFSIFTLIVLSQFFITESALITQFILLLIAVILHNLVVSYLTQRLQKDFTKEGARSLSVFQASIDLLMVIFLIHLSGGIESIFLYFLVFQMIIAGIMLPKKEAYLQALLASVLCVSMFFAEHFRLIGHLHVITSNLPLHGLHADRTYLLIKSVEFPIILMVTTYLADYLSTMLRTKQEGIKELTTLINIGKFLSSSLDLDETLNIILDTAIAEAGTSAGSVALYDEEEDELTLKAAKGFSKSFIKKTHKWRLRPGGMTEAIVKNKKTFVIEDVSKEFVFTNPIGIDEGIAALIAVPLVTEDNVIGVLYVDDFKPRKFTESEVRMVSLFATQAAIAIANAQLHEQTRNLAIRDGLTGLFNHRHFRNTLEKEIKRSDRYHHPLALTMMDIDNFKGYNDSHGHLEGDDLLRSVADLLSKHARQIDIVARYGGDEFSIISPVTEKERVIEMVKRIDQEIVEKFFKVNKGYELVGMSYGVASFPQDAKDADELIKKADLALYEAKRSKRKRIAVYNPAKYD